MYYQGLNIYDLIEYDPVNGKTKFYNNVWWKKYIQWAMYKEYDENGSYHPNEKTVIECNDKMMN